MLEQTEQSARVNPWADGTRQKTQPPLFIGEKMEFMGDSWKYAGSVLVTTCNLIFLPFFAHSNINTFIVLILWCFWN